MSNIPLFVLKDDFHQKVYVALINMNTRCYNPNYNRSHRYLGRGITVCEDWRGGTEKHYKKFLEDMGIPPTLFHSLDRKKNDENYSKDNCKWSTDKEQAFNRDVKVNTECIIYSQIYNKSWEIYHRNGAQKKHLFLAKFEIQAESLAKQIAQSRGLNYVKR